MTRDDIFKAVGCDNMLTIAGFLGAFEVQNNYEHPIDSEEDFFDGVWYVAKHIAAYPEDADIDFWAEMQNGAEEWYKKYQEEN